jgi:hypothetical protein
MVYTANSNHDLRRNAVRRMVLLLLFVVVSASSCTKKKELVTPVVSEWNGKHVDVLDTLPVCVIWYEPNESEWTKHKTIVEPNDIRLVMRGILSPEVDYWRARVGMGRTENLSLFFYDPCDRSIRVVEVSFRLNGTEFWGPRGNSKVLGEFLSKGKPPHPRFRLPQDPNIGARMQTELQAEVGRAMEAKKRKQDVPNVPK